MNSSWREGEGLGLAAVGHDNAVVTDLDLDHLVDAVLAQVSISVS
jgi:hypothetical protein